MRIWFVVALLAGCGSGNATDGRALFQTICVTCHGPTGKPMPEMVARLHVHDLTAPEFRARVTPDLVENQVRWGSKNMLMPGYDGMLHDEQIKALADYVASPAFVTP